MSKNNLIERPDNLELLCFGGNDWWYHNRDHIDVQMARQFVRFANVMYVNSIVMQKLDIKHGNKFISKVIRKVRSICRGLKSSGHGFWVYSPLSLPVHHIAWLRPLNTIILQSQLCFVTRMIEMRNPIIWVACPAACDTALKLKRCRLVYQRTDRFEDYPNIDIKTIIRYDRKLKAEADLTLFVNTQLYEEEVSQCKKAIFLDHGVDFEMFASAEQNPYRPTDITDIPKPIVGYFGALDEHKLDISFLETLSELLAEISFVFVGKISLQFSRLAERGNVWLLGQKDYKQIPHYGKCFDVAIIPWRHNQWTAAANPIKLKEYLALGKPIVSTPAFTELQLYLDVVSVADTAEGFAGCIEKALAEDGSERIATRREKVKNATWDDKVGLVLKELFGKDTDLQG